MVLPIDSVSLRSTSLSYEKIIFFSFTERERERRLEVSRASFACVLLMVSVRKFFTADFWERMCVYVFPCLKRKFSSVFPRWRKSSQKRPKIKNLYAKRNEATVEWILRALLMTFRNQTLILPNILVTHIMRCPFSSFFSLNLHDH